MYLGHNWNHVFFIVIIYSLGLTTGLVIAFNRIIKDRKKENEESLNRLQEVSNSWKKRDYDDK